MKFLSFTIFIVMISTASNGDEKVSRSCFRHHIEEAIKLNLERRPQYAILSRGRSKLVSNSLIASEFVTKLTARIFDQKARYWQDYGIPILCDDFAPMSDAGDMVTEPLPGSDADFKSVDGMTLAARLSKKMTSWEELHEQIEIEIEALDTYPEYNCMVRHILESIRRTSRLSPSYIRTSAELGLRSPEKLLQNYLRGQILILPLADRLDSWAAPLQKEGIPIICNDVPPIH